MMEQINEVLPHLLGGGIGLVLCWYLFVRKHSKGSGDGSND